MTLAIFITPKARADTKAFFHYIAEDSQQAADRFLDRLEETINIIAKFPLLSSSFESGEPELEGMRCFAVKDFPKHLIFYIPDESKIKVIRIFHQAQDIMRLLSNG